MNEQDQASKAKLLEMCRGMTLEELRRFCIGTLRASAWSQRVMFEKFGKGEWDKFNRQVETGEIDV